MQSRGREMWFRASIRYLIRLHRHNMKLATTSTVISLRGNDLAIGVIARHF